MPPPHFPNEVVIEIFYRLYQSLRVHPGQEYLDSPIASHLVFSRLSKVSKTWHALALPFLVRYFDGQESRIGGFIALVKTYDLARHLHAIHFNHEIVDCESLNDRYGALKSRNRVIEGSTIDDDSLLDEAAEQVRYDAQKRIASVVDRWSPLARLNLRNVGTIEMGIRPEVGTILDHDRWRELTDAGLRASAKGLRPGEQGLSFLLWLLSTSSVAQSITQLRLNVHDGVQLKSIGDAAFALFPNLTDLTLAFYTASRLKAPPALSTLNLEHLRILDLSVYGKLFREYVVSAWIAPSAATLRSLEFCSQSDYGGACSREMTKLFGDVAFPSLTSLVLKGEEFYIDETFADRFPVVESAQLPIRGDLNAPTFPSLDSSLVHLTLTDFRGDDNLNEHKSLESLLIRRHFDQLSSLTLTSPPLYRRPSPLTGREQRRVDRLWRSISRLCRRKGISLSFDGTDVEDSSSGSEDDDDSGSDSW
ncbi:hypothetical protein JCM10212_004276 [Sporobolomyces blumeae]